MADDGKEDNALEGTVPCPWCNTPSMKDTACNWVCCGLITGTDKKEKFMPGFGCGHQFCFQCGKKLCTQVFHGSSGAKLSDKRNHGADCCTNDGSFCPGGHNAHCKKRW